MTPQQPNDQTIISKAQLAVCSVIPVKHPHAPLGRGPRTRKQKSFNILGPATHKHGQPRHVICVYRPTPVSEERAPEHRMSANHCRYKRGPLGCTKPQVPKPGDTRYPALYLLKFRKMIVRLRARLRKVPVGKHIFAVALLNVSLGQPYHLVGEFRHVVPPENVIFEPASRASGFFLLAADLFFAKATLVSPEVILIATTPLVVTSQLEGIKSQLPTPTVEDVLVPPLITRGLNFPFVNARKKTAYVGSPMTVGSRALFLNPTNYALKYNFSTRVMPA